MRATRSHEFPPSDTQRPARAEPVAGGRVATLVALLSLQLGCRQVEGASASPADSTSAATSRDGASKVRASALSREEIDAIVDAPDRTAEDKEADVRRKPREFLAFLKIHPGMRVADLGAGFGYTTELLARAVGPDGKVYGQNPRFVLERFAEAAWAQRLSRPVNAVVERVDREFVEPLPAEVQNLDLVVNVLFYHDFEWMGVDRARHNAAVFAALAPGGRYVIVDAHAATGQGAADSKALHRIEETLVRAELQAAGFELVEEGDFLANPNDTRDWNALPWSNERGEFSDKFVLAFQRPVAR